MALVLMVIQSLTFAAQTLLLFMLTGFCVVELLALDLDGLELLLTPCVGFAVIALVCQWLTLLLPTSVILLSISSIIGVVSVWLLWLRWAQLLLKLKKRRYEIVFCLGAGAIFYLCLLAPVFHSQSFTLAGSGTDALYIYAPVGEYLKTHPFLPGKPLTVQNPATYFLQGQGNFFPKSLGTITGGLSSLLSWPVYRLLEPLDALLGAVLLPALYVFVASGLHLSRRVATTAVVLLMANQLMYWIMGLDFQQEILALPLLPTTLAVLIHAEKARNLPAAFLVGLMAVVMLGLYLPLFGILLVSAGSFLAVMLLQRWKQRQLPGGLHLLLVILSSGIVLGLPVLDGMLLRGGLAAWIGLLQQRYPAGEPPYSLEYLINVVPLAAGYRLVPLLFWRFEWGHISKYIALLWILFLFLGLLTLLIKRKFPELALFGAALLYLIYLGVVARYHYGFMKTFGYILPLSAALIATGTGQFLTCFPPKQPPATATDTMRATCSPFNFLSGLITPIKEPLAFIFAYCLASIIVVEIICSIEMEQMFTRLGPSFPPSYEKLAMLQTLSPPLASIYMDNTGTYLKSNEPINTFTAAAYFLTDRHVVIANHPLSPDPLRGQNLTPDTLRPYNFILLSTQKRTQLPGDFQLLWRDDVLSLEYYRRADKL